MRIQGEFELHDLHQGLKEKNSKISLIETEMGQISPTLNEKISLPSVALQHDSMKSVYDTVESRPEASPEHYTRQGMLYQSNSGHQTFYNS